MFLWARRDPSLADAVIRDRIAGDCTNGIYGALRGDTELLFTSFRSGDAPDKRFCTYGDFAATTARKANRRCR